VTGRGEGGVGTGTLFDGTILDRKNY